MARPQKTNKAPLVFGIPFGEREEALVEDSEVLSRPGTRSSEKPGIPRPPSRATSPTPSAGLCFWSPSRAQPTSRCRAPYRIGIVGAPAWQGSRVCRRVPFPPCPTKCCVRPSQLQANCRGGGMSCWGLHTASPYVSRPYPLGSLTVGPTWFLHQPS